MNKIPVKSKYDLEERIAKFAEGVIEFSRSIKQDAVNRRIIDQLVGSAGSAGANYCEANGAESKKDFIHKVSITRKELNESKHWLRLFAKANPERSEEIKKLWREAHELLLIFSRIIYTSKSK